MALTCFSFSMLHIHREDVHVTVTGIGQKVYKFFFHTCIILFWKENYGTTHDFHEISVVHMRGREKRRLLALISLHYFLTDHYYECVTLMENRERHQYKWKFIFVTENILSL